MQSSEAVRVKENIPGGFRIVREVGRGAFAGVYEATAPGGDRVAVKILDTDMPHAVERFRREAKVLQALPENPHVIKYIASGSLSDGRPYIVMEYVKGFTLGKLLRAGRRLTESAACRLMMQLCEAFAELHKLGLTHGDIKPDNIMLSKDDGDLGDTYQVQGGSQGPKDVVHLAQVERSGMSMKLLDFGQVRDAQGLLKLLEAEDMLKGHDFAEDLDAGMVAGTPEYVSPEQVRDAKKASSPFETDTPSDVFGLCAIFFELLSGDTPWPFAPSADQGKRYIAEARQYLESRAEGQSMPRAPSNCSPALWSIIARGLNSDPKKRQGDAKALFHDIQRYDMYGVGVPGDLDNEETVMAFLPDLAPGGDAPSEDVPMPTTGKEDPNRRVDRRAASSAAKSWIIKAGWVLLAGGIYAALAFDLI